MRLKQSCWSKFVDIDNFVTANIIAQPLSLGLIQRLSDEDTAQPLVNKRAKAKLPAKYGLSYCEFGKNQLVCTTAVSYLDQKDEGLLLRYKMVNNI